MIKGGRSSLPKSISYLLVGAKFFLQQRRIIRFSRSFSLNSTAFRIYSKSIRILEIPVPSRAAAAPSLFYYPRAEKKKEGEPEEKEKEKEKEEEEEEMAASSREDVRERLLKHFPNGTSDTPDRWAMLWEQGDFLPWDIGAPNPALGDVLTDRKELFGTCFKEEEEEEEEEDKGVVRNRDNNNKVRKRALVPGCGRGYDVSLLASFGYDAYGLEVSDKAVELCVQEHQKNGDKYPIKDESDGYGKVTFLKGDFFRDEWTEKIPGDGKFDLIYDYTVRTLFFSFGPPPPLPFLSPRFFLSQIYLLFR